MLLLAISGGLLLALALIVREYQLARERVLQDSAYEQLRMALEATRVQMRRVCEDVYVLQSVLAERNLLDEGELVRGRMRLVEVPRRLARERDAIQQHLGTSDTSLVLDDSDGKIH